MENWAAYPHQEFTGGGGDSNRICQEPKARAMQEIRNPESLKYFRQWYLESWKFCLWNSDPGLWNPECSSRISGMPLTIGIGDPRRGIQNPGLSWIPLHGATRRCSHPRYPAKLEFIDDFIYLGSVINNKDGFEIKEISIK